MEEDKETKPDKGKGPEVMDSFAPLLDQISETIGRFRGMFEEPEVAAKVNEFGSKVLGFDGSNSEFDLDGSYAQAFNR